jgi:hypothetical protein
MYSNLFERSNEQSGSRKIEPKLVASLQTPVAVAEYLPALKTNGMIPLRIDGFQLLISDSMILLYAQLKMLYRSFQNQFPLETHFKKFFNRQGGVSRSFIG